MSKVKMSHLSLACIFIVILLSFGPYSVLLQESDNDTTDYYWREYTGVIPSDALPGGKDKSGKTTYIGQMYYREFGIHPATIREGSKSARSAAGSRSFYAEDYVKILCTKNPKRYRWIPTKNEESQLLKNVHLVVGGTGADFILNIGRVNHEMEVVVGHVFAYTTPYRGLTIPHKKDQAVTYQTYEILTYSKHYENADEICMYSS